MVSGLNFKDILFPKWFAVLTVFGLIFCATHADAQTDVSGNISVNTTWDVSGSPYVLTGRTTVNAGVTLR